jgi:hypothetical protein
MRFDADRLMALLPAVYRIRDAERGELRQLMEIIAAQAGVLEEDLEQLYDDQFVDTCAEWVLPYIGDLLGNTPLYSGDPRADDGPRALFPELSGPRFVPHVAVRGRPDVAKTISYRKRKATRAMLEELAADVTGWAAHVVELFEILRWTQCIRNHTRLFNTGCPDLRNADALKRLDGPFDSIPHAVDVRPINTFDGWHETRNIGFFLWRLRSYALENIDPFHATANLGYQFLANRLGLQAPLFAAGGRGDNGSMTEEHAPGPIRESLMRTQLADFYGEDRSLAIAIEDQTVTPPQLKTVSASLICARDLTNWERPKKKTIAVDVQTGRISFGDDYGTVDPKTIRVSYHYGFSADLGGGSYPRASWLIKRAAAEQVITVGKDATVKTISDALLAWNQGGQKKTIIEIEDSRTYDEPASLLLDPPKGSWIAIEAKDSCFPHIRSASPIVVKCGDDLSWVALSGLLIEANIEVQRLTGRLRLMHTTLQRKTGVATIEVPAAIAAATSDTFRLEAAFSITGPIRLATNGRGMVISDCIVDGGGFAAIVGAVAGEPAPPLTIERSTVFGSLNVRELSMASETIFTGRLDVARRQHGCARFCFITRDSHTPRRYRCQPDLEIRTIVEREERQTNTRLSETRRKAIAAEVVPWLVPAFTSTRYGDPGYGQLHLNAPRQIARGAEDGSEMGVLCHLKQPQRETNLRSRLTEYLPFGLQAGFIYVT